LFTLPSIVNAESLNEIKKNLKKEDIAGKKVSVQNKSASKTKPAAKIQNKQSNAQSTGAMIVSPDYAVIDKPVKIKVNGRAATVMVPFINPTFQKKHKAVKASPKRISERAAPLRIGEESGAVSYDVPCPFAAFNFQMNPDDEMRFNGEKKLLELYELISSINSANYGSLVSKIYSLNQEILENYKKYDDLCALALFYASEVIVKYFESLGYFNSIYTTNSPIYFQYEQLKMQYGHLKDSNDAFKVMFAVIEQRQKQIKNNEAVFINSNNRALNELEQYKKDLQNTMNEVYSGKPTDDYLNNFTDKIAALYSAILIRYMEIYQNNMTMNNKDEADSILKIEKNENGYIISGKLYDIYNSVPYSANYKYQYLTEYIPGQKQELKTAEVKVNLYKNAETFLDIVKNMRILQTLDKIDEPGSDDMSRNEKRTLDICNFIKDYKPSEGSETSEITKEKIDAAKLNNYKNNAFALIDNDGKYSDYYKRKPVISKAYFANISGVPFNKTGIKNPEEFITARAELNYAVQAPGYAFKGKIYAEDYTSADEASSDDSNESGLASDSSENTVSLRMKTENYRERTIKFIPDSINGGYYAKFRINETDTGQNPPTVVAAPVPGVDGNNQKIFFDTAKDAEKESISVLSGFYGHEDGLPLYENKNNYFKKQLLRASYKGNDIANNVVNNTREFCMMGGANLIRLNAGNLDDFEYVKNQADWFMIEGHGAGDGDGHIEFIDDNDKIISIRPEELEKQYNEDMDVLILDACFCLSQIGSQCNAKKWQKVLPDGLILGFTDDGVDADFTSEIMKGLSSKLQNGILPKAIGDLYLDVCKSYLTDNLDKWFPTGTSTYISAAYLFGGNYGYIEKVEFISKYKIPISAYIRRYKTIK